MVTRRRKCRRRQQRRRGAGGGGGKNHCSLLALAAVTCTIVGRAHGNLGHSYTPMSLALPPFVGGGNAESFVEVYENEVFDSRRKEWIASSDSRWTHGDGSAFESPLRVTPPKGDRFVDEWKIDVSRDELGWEYFVQDGARHRRRRWVRSVEPAPKGEASGATKASAAARAKQRRSIRTVPSWREALRDNFNFKGYGVSIYKSLLSLPSFGGSLRMPLTTHFDWFDRHPWVPIVSTSMGMSHFFMSSSSSKKSNKKKKSLGEILSSLFFSEQDRGEILSSFRRVRAPQKQQLPKQRVASAFVSISASIPVAVLRFVFWDIWYRICVVRYHVQRTVRSVVVVPVLTLLALPYRILLWILIATGEEGYPASPKTSKTNSIGWIVKVPQPQYPSMPVGRRNLQLFAMPDVSERVGISFSWRINSAQPGVEFRISRWYSWLPLFVFLQDMLVQVLNRLFSSGSTINTSLTETPLSSSNSTTAVDPAAAATRDKGVLSEWLRQKAGRIGLYTGYPVPDSPYFFCSALISLSALYNLGILRLLMPTVKDRRRPSRSTTTRNENVVLPPLETSAGNGRLVDDDASEEEEEEELLHKRAPAPKIQSSPQKKKASWKEPVGEPIIETTFLQS